MTKPKFRLNTTFPFDKMIFLHSDSPSLRGTTRPQTDGNRLEYVIYMQKWLMTFCYTEETSDFETKYYYYVAACQTGVSTSSSTQFARIQSLSASQKEVWPAAMVACIHPCEPSSTTALAHAGRGRTPSCLRPNTEDQKKAKAERSADQSKA